MKMRLGQQVKALQPCLHSLVLKIRKFYADEVYVLGYSVFIIFFASLSHSFEHLNPLVSFIRSCLEVEF